MKRLLMVLLIIGALFSGYSRLDGILYPGSTQAATSFLETFDGAPGGPTQFKSPRWDIAIHGRDNRDLLRQYDNAGHGTDCGPAPGTHATGGRFESTVFQCRDHVMTALHADGYGIAYMTPNHMVDFSQGEAVIRWDMSTFRTSERDWMDVWISPYNDNLQMPLNPGFPDLQGPPRRAVQVLLSTENALCPEVWVDGQAVEDNTAPYRCRVTSWENIPGFPGVSAVRRDTFEIRISRTRLKVGMPAYNFYWYDQTLRQPLDWNQGIVQYGQHSYSPEKGTRFSNPGPNTIHWDNVSINPAVPFTMIHSDRRFVDAASPTVNFTSPSPANAHLRFTAWGTNVEYSTNGGATWQAARKAVQDNDCCHIFNYWTPIPAGVTSVRFRAEQWPGGAWQAKDISIWASGSGTVPPTTTPTATPTSLPATATIVPPTATTVPPTATTVPPTATTVPATATTVPPTATTVPATATPRPTNTPVPATATPRATNTPAPATATPGATNTPAPATATPRATNTPAPATATPRATNTPAPATATPRATNTPVPATPTSTVLSFTSVARVSPITVVAGQTETIVATVTSTQNTTVLVDIEVYDAAGNKVHQRFYDNVALTAGVKRNFSANWVIPATMKPGTYTVKVGVFRPGWGSLLHWNNAAKTFVVTAP